MCKKLTRINRKKISFSDNSLKEIEKIRNEKRLRNDSEVIDFLLEEYLRNKEKEIEDSMIFRKLGRIDYEIMFTQLLLKKVTPDIIGREDPTSLFIKIERDLKNKLRNQIGE